MASEGIPTAGEISDEQRDRLSWPQRLAWMICAMPELLKSFAGDSSVTVRTAALVGLTRLGPEGVAIAKNGLFEADRYLVKALAQALAEGVRAHVADLRRRVPGASLVVQVDEPALPTVLAGKVPTASGFHRHRSVDDPEASPALEWVMSAVRESGATPMVHCCAPDVPISLLTGAGARGVSVDLSVLGPASYDGLGEVLETDRTLMLGVVPSADPATWPDERSLTERVQRLLDMLGLDPADPEGTGELVVTPSCGLAGASPGWARRACDLSARVARNLGAG